MAVIASPMNAIATLASEKLRSLNRPSGTSGSAFVLACQSTKSPSRTTPAMIRCQEPIGPRNGPQLCELPSWMPKTSRNMAAALEPDAQPVEGVRVALQLRHLQQHAPDGEDAHRHVDEEDPFPAQGVHEHAAEDRADQRGDAGDRAPQAHGRAAAGVGEHAGNERHGLRAHHGGAQALHHARGDQRFDVGREPAPQRGEREDGQADQEDVARAEPVAQAPGDQQRHRKRQQVGAVDPDHPVDVGVQAVHDRRHGGGDDGGVHQDHEEPDDQGPQGTPRHLVLGSLCRFGFGLVLVHRTSLRLRPAPRQGLEPQLTPARCPAAPGPGRRDGRATREDGRCPRCRSPRSRKSRRPRPCGPHAGSPSGPSGCPGAPCSSPGPARNPSARCRTRRSATRWPDPRAGPRRG